ncbi:Hypothetical protein BCD_1367 (plasmid) [Borrelia crocidurae DOU]|uniref:Uncharacterized protein n=1 Tax=Borrelia crocidurae DOU TaxID=1293575 RepID=W5SL85_9SPIR|nr:hypothetical protein [Borrelia crocidurae]AHH07433.1 Hypothetical protein BCD_1367 [Borrelia crocidurae DOU]
MQVRINGAYRQLINATDLEYHLNNNKILQNPIINALYEEDTFTEIGYAYVYPVIYNMYTSKETPSISFFIQSKYHTLKLRHIWHSVSVDRSTPKWTLYKKS